MNSPHVVDLAASYALGALGDDDMAAVDAHLRECAGCAQAIGSAEDQVAILAGLERRHEPPPALDARIARILDRRSARRFPAALAAALLLGLLPSAYFWSESAAMHSAMTAQGEALERLASTPHRSVAFHAAVAGPAAATVSYATDGSWYVIVVPDATRTLEIAWMHDGTHTMLGSAVPRGGIAMLYLPRSHRMSELALMDGARIIARAELAWGRTSPGRPSARSESQGAETTES